MSPCLHSGDGSLYMTPPAVGATWIGINRKLLEATCRRISNTCVSFDKKEVGFLARQ